MTMKCGNCKFWEKYAETQNPYGTCAKIKHSDSYRKNVGLAKVVDGSGYYAALKTCEDFGCVLFVEKECEKSLTTESSTSAENKI